MKKLMIVALALAACAKQEQPTGASKDDRQAAAQKAKDRADQQAKLAARAEDQAQPGPEEGKFTLEEATAGLEGGGKKLFAEIATDHGTMTCELFPQSAPETVASFVGLARGVRPFLDPKTGEWVKRPYFDGLAFHRVMPKFMIQGGDPLSASYDDPAVGTGGPGYTLPDEIDAKLKFDKAGRLAMANSGAHQHTGGSQFFITEKDVGQLDGDYVIFGQCDGEGVVQKIARVEVDHPRHNKPVTPITMKVRIFKK